MAIQSQFYSDNFGFGLGGRGVVLQDNYAENGFGLNGDQYLNLHHGGQQQQQQYMEFQQQQQEQKFQFLQLKNEMFGKSGFGPKNHSHELGNLSAIILSQMEKQRQEIDQFISVQNQRLRLALMEQRKQQISTILKKYESRAAILVKQKDEEIAKILNKNFELANMIRAMEIESQTWQRVAKENEAMVMSLNNTIEQLKGSDAPVSLKGVTEDAESCCDDNAEFQQNEEDKKVMNMCRSCNSWESCVILLPCRHLCSCKSCDAFLDSCPVCGMLKKTSIEVLF